MVTETKKKTPAPKTVKIGFGNGHNEESLVHMVEKTNCVSFGCAEADRRLPELEALDKYDLYVGGRTRCPGEVPVLVKKTHRVVGHEYHHISDAIPGLTKVAPDRWSTQVRYRHPLATSLEFKGIAHINFHPDAGPEQLNGNDAHAAIVVQYKAAWAHVKASVRKAKKDGFLVVVTGDLQMTAEAKQAWGPTKQFASVGLQSFSKHIDWIAFDPAIKIKKVETPDLYDHPAVIATFVAA